mmetsp:Transcript_14567/g.44033  ORF Transcript_14567/g.44033 Transcript_14567/m.44033 type:complete len:80 (+) Transcript_14567:1-240(+)
MDMLLADCQVQVDANTLTSPSSPSNSSHFKVFSDSAPERDTQLLWEHTQLRRKRIQLASLHMCSMCSRPVVKIWICHMR